MERSFLSSHSFKVRAKVSIGIVLVVIIGALTPNSYGLRAVYTLAAIISMCEIDALISAGGQPKRVTIHGWLSMAMLALSIVAVLALPRALLILGIVLTMASDVGAYMVGKTCGARFITFRPFPNVSPNKSWEGVIGGLLIPGLVIPVFNYLPHTSWSTHLPIFVGCLAGFFAILGDASESAFKRGCNVKDANDFLKVEYHFRHIEALLGGSEGHGGYFDRLDSMSVVMILLEAVTVLYAYLLGV